MLASLEMTLPLKKASNLSKPALRDKIIVMSEGLLGQMIDLLEDATIEAILTGEELITPALLDSLGWVTATEQDRMQANV